MLLNNERFGKIYFCGNEYFIETARKNITIALIARGTWEFDGGAFMNQASQYIDLLDWLIGPVESVMAYTATLARHIEVEDSGVAAVRWRSGAIGTVNVTMSAPYPRIWKAASPFWVKKARLVLAA